jgi:ribonuclease VapC
VKAGPVRIVVDTSALAAILLGEPEREAFEDALLTSEPAMSAGSVIKTLRVAQLGLGDASLAQVHALLAVYRVATIPVDDEQVRLAADGMRRFGKGRGQEPAVLNFGDLFAYALARQLGAPLLCKDDDFARTDIALLRGVENRRDTAG